MAQNQNAKDIERIDPIGVQNSSLKLEFGSDRNAEKVSRTSVSYKMHEVL